MSAAQSPDHLTARIRALEEKVLGLRASRRLLMSLLAEREGERWATVARLEAENHRLRRSQARWARRLLERDRRIARLEEELRRRDGAGGSATAT